MKKNRNIDYKDGIDEFLFFGWENSYLKNDDIFIQIEMENAIDIEKYYNYN